MFASTGTRRAIASKSSRVSGTPQRPAIAIRWMSALVDPPSASTVAAASSNASLVSTRSGVRSAQTIATIRLPLAAAIRWCAESTAGIEAAPGSVRPSASAADVIVDAVPIVMQCPGERAIPDSISASSHSPISPARWSSQYFHTSVPLPSGWPRKLPRSIGPAGT